MTSSFDFAPPKLRRPLLFAALFLQTAPLYAADPTPPSASPTDPGPQNASRTEAAQRFERALKLFNSGDNAGALAEFKRTYEILPNALVLYNIGLVYAAMGRPVDAVDALESALKSGDLPPKELEHAKQTHADQQARIARLTVTTTPPNARVEVDGVHVATTPLVAPIRISEGSHIIGAVATGYTTSRKEVVVAGNSDTSVHLDLIPAQEKQPATLTVRTRTQGAEVLVNGKVVGQTPLTTSISLPPGRHVVELRRPGYTPARRELELQEAARGELDLGALSVDASAPSQESATLVLDASEAQVELSVDGVRQGIYKGPVRLPKGPHRLSVTSAGFVPRELDVNLAAERPNVVKVELDPTPETRRAYERSAKFHRTWGFIGIIAGAVIGGAGGALFAVSTGEKADAQDELDALNAQEEAGVEPPCDWKSGYAAEGNDKGAECNRVLGDAEDKVNAAKTRSIIGIAGIGVGGAVAVTGLVLLLTGEDPNKYDRPRVALVPGPGELGAGVKLAF